MERKHYDKFIHVREIFEVFTNNYKRSYTVGENCTLDEMLLTFRGRCAFQQYMLNKPNKYGLKTYALVEAWTHYMLNWEALFGCKAWGTLQSGHQPSQFRRSLLTNLPMRSTKGDKRLLELLLKLNKQTNFRLGLEEDAIYVKRTVNLNIPTSIALNLFVLATLNTLVLSAKIKYRSKLDSQCYG